MTSGPSMKEKLPFGKHADTLLGARPPRTVRVQPVVHPRQGRSSGSGQEKPQWCFQKSGRRSVRKSGWSPERVSAKLRNLISATRG